MRKRRAVKRDVLPDPIYNSKVITKLINSIMLDGKKGIAQTILYEAFGQPWGIATVLLAVPVATIVLVVVSLLTQKENQKA